MIHALKDNVDPVGIQGDFLSDLDTLLGEGRGSSKKLYGGIRCLRGV